MEANRFEAEHSKASSLEVNDLAADGLDLTSVNDVASALKQVADDAEARFGRLSAPQLNWKPEPTQWSVAQCLDHLIVIQSSYFPLFDRLQEGTFSPTLWERLSPFSRPLGRALIRALDPENPRKSKAAASTEPSMSDLSSDIVPRFVQHQEELAGRVRALPGTLDAGRVIITSPMSAFVTYSLEDCFAILVVHGRRHLAQAERVTQAPGFPS